MPEELLSTKFAAQCVGVSETYFRQLAAQPEPIHAEAVKGSRVSVWRQSQVRAVAERVKRPNVKRA